LTAAAITTPSTHPLHDALPISERVAPGPHGPAGQVGEGLDVQHAVGGAMGRVGANLLPLHGGQRLDIRLKDEFFQGRFGKLVPRDRKSTRLNSSHVSISYAVFC